MAPPSGLNPEISQFLSQVGHFLNQLDQTWTHLGYNSSDPSKASNKDAANKLLPTLQTLHQLVKSELIQRKLIEANITDQMTIIESSCEILGRPIEQYTTWPLIHTSRYNYETEQLLSQTILELQNIIKTRRNQAHQAHQRILVLTNELQLPLREFDLDVLTTDVSATVVEPILHYCDQLEVRRQLHINLFNTALSRVYFKWTSLSMEPESKNELDLQLGELFETVPDIISVPLSLPGLEPFPHSISVYNWFDSPLPSGMLPLGNDYIQMLLDKSHLDSSTSMPLVSRQDLVAQLKYLYGLADWDVEQLPEKLGDLLLISLKKIKLHRDEVDLYVDTNIDPLNELHLKRLTELWEICHVAQETKVAFHSQLEELVTPRMRLEAIYDDFVQLKFQFDNAPDIFSKIRRRKFIIDKLREFEAQHSSKDRFKGSSLALLQEEKFRKKEYPALCQLENVLLKMVIEYEIRLGKTFKYEGGKFRLILEKSIERRAGNLEIIGLKDAMSTESFSRSSSKPKDLESARSSTPVKNTSRSSSRATSRATSRSTSRAASRTGHLSSQNNSTKVSPNLSVNRTPPQPLRSPIPSSLSGSVSPSYSHSSSPLMSPTPRHRRPSFNTSKPSTPLNTTPKLASKAHSSSSIHTVSSKPSPRNHQVPLPSKPPASGVSKAS